MNTAIGAAGFEQYWYVVRRAVIDPQTALSLHEHVLARANGPRVALGDNQVTNAPVAYGDPRTDALLENVRGRVEEATGLPLWPAYSYFRVYQHGNVLKAHRDRSSCEVSMTVTLGMDADEPWPLWIAGPMGTAAVALLPGDGLVYRGCDCYHWREPFPGRHLAQLFLHYVERDGYHAEWKFDKRAALAGP